LCYCLGMHRFAITYLHDWKQRPLRKPLVIRGARQVGKTELVRMFAARDFERLVEINFDETPGKASLFMGDDVSETIRLLEIDLGVKIEPGKCLLFLDEIQAFPELLAKLRYFYEKLPGLHVICAGSLLDFVLAEHRFSMPVGRLEFLFLGPMSFGEFLLASAEEGLSAYLNSYDLIRPIPAAIHEKLLKRLREFMVTGGMPGVLNAFFLSGKDWTTVAREQQSIIQTYLADFAKYGHRIDVQLMERIFRKIPAQVGRSVKYVSLDADATSAKVKENLELLEKARLMYRVFHSDGNGLPLGAELSGKRFKLLFLDVGLLNAFLGLKLTDYLAANDIIEVNSGALAEQFIGQHLLYGTELYAEPELYFWTRSDGSKVSATAEVDYLTTHGSRIVPVEVKAGKTGRLKSLHMFVCNKNAPLAVRFNGDQPSAHDAVTSVATKERRQFCLLSLPLYLVQELPRLIDLAGKTPDARKP